MKMAFKVRALYKPAMAGQDEEVDIQELVRRNEYLERVKNAVRNNNKKSSNSSYTSYSELKEMLKMSSVNPDINPSIKKKLDDLLEQEKSNKVEIVTEELPEPPKDKKLKTFDPASDPSMSQPPRAAMLRGYKRSNALGVNSIKKTAHGLVDAF